MPGQSVGEYCVTLMSALRIPALLGSEEVQSKFDSDLSVKLSSQVSHQATGWLQSGDCPGSEYCIALPSGGMVWRRGLR